MTITAKRFQITWMVCTMFAQFERMVTMAIFVFCRLAAILANAAVALVHPLLERQPEINAHPAVPGETLPRKFIESKKPCHTLPYLTTPRLARTCLDKPCLTRHHPYHKGVIHTTPYLTRPCRALHRLVAPDPALTTKTLSIPCLARPSPTSPNHAPQCHVSPLPQRAYL